MNFTGYFLLGSKFGGLTRKPWTLSPFAPGNQKDSNGDMEIRERVAWLSDSIRCGANPASTHSFFSSKPGLMQTGIRSHIVLGPSNVIFVKKIDPFWATTMSSL